MNDRQYALYQSFVRVLAFTKEHGTDFNAASSAGQAITSLTAIVSQLRPHTDGQAGADASPATAAKEDLVDALRQDLKDIARTARAIEASTPAQTGLASRFALPDERTQRSIIAHARSVLATFHAETGLAARFIAYELPADFVADLQQDLAAYDAATDTQAEDRIGSVEGTAQARVLLREGRAAVIQLNASVLNKYRRQPEVIAAWKTASRVDQPQTAVPSDSPPPASAS